jgi:hypothetical protein
MSSNVRLMTNVLCVKQDNLALSIDNIVARLGYFELLEYKRLNPILFSLTNYRYTQRQLIERDSPRGRSHLGLTRLWTLRSDLKPMPPVQEPNPFEDDEEPDRKEVSRLTVPESSVNVPPTPVISASEHPVAAKSEQEIVINAPPKGDMLVVAPPGTGKTHVLVERIASLVKSGRSSNPLEEILVLSFTRSAVAELRKRLLAKVENGGDERMLYARIRTFDSLATHLLKLDLAPQDLVSGYSQRIDQLNEGLSNGSLPKTEEDISKVRFLLVDEVQDLNDARALMVLELAKRVSLRGGCSIFLGDPAQAIYDFSTQGSLSALDFLRRLVDGDYGEAPPKRIEFTEYRRFETTEIREFVCAARAAMGNDGLSADGAQLDALLRSLGARLPLQLLKSEMNRPGRKAILTRTNLEAYWIWDYCNRKEIPAELWRGSSGSYWPGWIGRLALGFQNDIMSLQMAEKRWKQLVAPYVSLSFEAAKKFLQDHGVLDPATGQVRIAEFNHLIGNGAPLASNTCSDQTMVISTIHRSKGLEFENVYLYAPRDNALGDADEVRVVYVAATRAKRHLQLIDRDTGIVRHGQRRKGYFETSEFHIFKYPASPHIGLLIDGADVVQADSILSSPQPGKDLEFLWEQCARVPRKVTVNGGKLLVQERFVGELGKAIQADLERIRSLRKAASVPLDGLVAHDLATVPIDPSNPLAMQSLGAACLSFVPVITGIVSI